MEFRGVEGRPPGRPEYLAVENNKIRCRLPNRVRASTGDHPVDVAFGGELSKPSAPNQIGDWVATNDPRNGGDNDSSTWVDD
jgi:hypothetical protein